MTPNIKYSLSVLDNLNNDFIDYDIKFDNRLGYKNKKGTKHHIIPVGYERMPNIVIYWTIKWLLNNKVEQYGFKIKDQYLLILNKKGTISLSELDHSELHTFLDFQKEALFALHNIIFLDRVYFKVEGKYKKLYADRSQRQSKLLNNDNIKKYKRNILNKEDNQKIVGVNNMGSLLTKSINTRKKKELRKKGREIVEIVRKEIGNKSLLINNNFLRILKYVNWKDNLQFLNESISLIRNKLQKESAELKVMFLIGPRDPGGNEYKTIKGFSDIISMNIISIQKIGPSIQNIFNLGLTSALKKITVFTDENNKIISGLEIIAFLYYSKNNNIEFNYQKLSKDKAEELINFIKRKK